MTKNLNIEYDENKGIIIIPIEQFQGLLDKLKKCEQSKQMCKKLNELLNQQIKDYDNLTRNN
jgi:hypothetical protein